MKSTSIKYSVAALLVFLLAGSSCKKILDLQPHNSTFTEAYFKTGTDANTAISGAYALLRSVLMAHQSWHVYGDLPSGEYASGGNQDAFTSPICNGQFVGLNVGNWEWNWQNYYQLIQQINLVINKVPQIPVGSFTDPALKTQIVGEAYFLRAFTYFYMSRIWGDVPLKLQPDLDVSQAANIPRTPAATVLAQCLADCDSAASRLVFGYSDPTMVAVRANKGSVYALKAHIQAWQHDYAACEKSADVVISQGKYQLVDSTSYAQVFIGRSPEGIFEININYAQSEGVALNNDDGSGDAGWLPTLADPYITGLTTPVWSYSDIYKQHIFPDSVYDFRKNLFFLGNNQTIKYSNIFFADGSKKSDPRLSNNLNIFRLADIMLLRAEALNKLGRDNEAITLLDAVRARSGLYAYDPSVPNTPDLEFVILEERQRELFYEGQAYYDLCRHGADVLNQYNSNFSIDQAKAGGMLWPIDPGMFRDDFTLTQTPYWRGKL